MIPFLRSHGLTIVLAALWLAVAVVMGRIGYNLGYGQGQWDCSLQGECRGGRNHHLPPPR